MYGNNIIRITPGMHGVPDEGTITTALLPGVCVEMVPNTAFTNGRPSWRGRSRTAGALGPVAILLDDPLQGFPVGTAYVAGKRGFVYWPQAGEEFNMLLADSGSTALAVTQGDLFGVDATGKILPNSSYASTPFQSMETLAALGGTPSELLWVKFLGSGT